MDEAGNDMEKKRKAEVAAEEEKEARKERIGRNLVARSLARKKGGTSDEQEGAGDGSEAGSAKKKRKTRHTPGDALDGELQGFGNALKEADLARIDLESRRLEFEKERLEVEKQDRVKDRAMRREEREAHNELELGKFKLLIGAFVQSKK
ncbi:unnamed protein product [Agarophyton chilense]|eukprot:gb/GEZJ01002898.1/.p2 GENE.gb/GEZJ01002898.1/~~gb/GEZJ01002898.1/.p2  ORF type:complete len:150 (-),score=40.15 gb/GEZJ01002898.1/:53-502(-)